MPSLYIITGSNGAGKLTVGPDYLPEEILNQCTVFDDDLLYTRKLNDLFPSITRSAKYARKDALEYVVDLFEEQTSHALANHDHYVYEVILQMMRLGKNQRSLKTQATVCI